MRPPACSSAGPASLAYAARASGSRIERYAEIQYALAIDSSECWNRTRLIADPRSQRSEGLETFAHLLIFRSSVHSWGTVHMIRVVAILGSLLVALSACAGGGAREVIALPNGYYLQPDQKRQTELVKRDGHRVLPGTIAAYSVSGQ